MGNTEEILYFILYNVGMFCRHFFLLQNVGYNLCLFLPDCFTEGLKHIHTLMCDLDFIGESHRNVVICQRIGKPKGQDLLSTLF